MLCSEFFYVVGMAVLRLWIFTWGFTLLLSIMFFWFIHYKKRKILWQSRSKDYFWDSTSPQSKWVSSVGKDVRGEEPSFTASETETNIAIMAISLEDPQKIKNKTPMWPSYSLPGKCPENSISLCSNIYTSMFNCWSMLQYHKMEPTCPSTDEWKVKMYYTYKMEYYSVVKKFTS